MTRTRLLHPGFFRNEALAELPPFARLLFAGLWTIADRAGRLEDRPRQIKLDVFPWDDVDVDELLDQLHNKELIVRYEIDGRRFIQVLQFLRYQSPHIREKASMIPASPCKASASTVLVPAQHSPRSPVSVFVSVPVLGSGEGSGSGEKEQRLTPPSPINVKVVTKIAHEAIDMVGWNSLDLAETVKTLCARYHVPYDGVTVGKAIESARVQRAKAQPA